MSSYRVKLMILAQMSDDIGDPSLADRFQRFSNDSYSPPGDAQNEQVQIMKERMAALIPSQLNVMLPEGVFAVGGSVRDLVMGREPHDIDLTTPVRPEEVMARCRASGIKVIETGLRHGTVTAIIDGEPYEITTFRTDVLTDGRHAVVAYTDSLSQDLIRRDFTINAMAIDPEGNLIDPFGGQEDIRRRRIETVGNPFHRFEEDYLRILRAARFAAVLGFEIEPETLAAMEVMGPELCRRISRAIEHHYRVEESLSVERVVDEFNKVFEKANHPSLFLNLMWNLGVMQTLVPEMENADILMQDPKWHPEGSVWQHIVDVVDRSDPKFRWHGLLHDVGKCLTAMPVEGYEHNSFHGHDVAGAGVIHEIAERLRLPGDLRDSIETSTRMHMYPLQTRMEGKEPSERTIRRFQREIPSDDHLLALKHLVPADSGDRYDPVIAPLFERRTDIVPVLQGRHLLEEGIQPGPDMGRRLKAAFEYQLETGIMDVGELKRVALSA